MTGDFVTLAVHRATCEELDSANATIADLRRKLAAAAGRNAAMQAEMDGSMGYGGKER
jgi:conjugal transfer/entry exclusion protein